jgi:PTS system mannitol-specific IIC component
LLLLKAFGKDDADFEAAQAKTRSNKAESKGLETQTFNAAQVKKIVFACDAGMGSSAMGATKLRKKLKEAGLDINVTHSPVSETPKDAGIIICHKELAERARAACPSARIIAITDFLNAPEYGQLISDLKG